MEAKCSSDLHLASSKLGHLAWPQIFISICTYYFFGLISHVFSRVRHLLIHFYDHPVHPESFTLDTGSCPLSKAGAELLFCCLVGWLLC